mgnify:CR=1 FL=1
MTADGTKYGQLEPKSFNMPAGEEGTRFNVYYGAFEVNIGWLFKSNTVGYQGEAVNSDGSVVAPSFDKLELGEDARLVVKGAKNLPQGELVTVLPFTTLEGMFASVVSDKGHVVLRYLEGHVDARRDAGFYIRVR